MPSTPLVSVIIPCHNGEAFIADAIASVFAQTYKPLEIIVIDDGSTDQSWDKIQDFGDCITGKQIAHSGAAQARNLGLYLAKGEYIQFLDADDLIAPEKISRQVAFMQENASEVSYTDARRHCLRKDAYYSLKGLRGAKDLVATFLNDKKFNALHSYLYAKRVIKKIGGWNTGISFQDDRFFNLTLAASGVTMNYIPGVFATYRRFPLASASRVAYRSKNEALKAVADMYSFYESSRQLLFDHDLALPKYLQIIQKKIYVLNRLATKLNKLPDFTEDEFASLSWSARRVIKGIFLS